MSYTLLIHARFQKGGGAEVQTTLENNNAIGLAILIWIPLKIKRLPSQYSMLGHHRPTSEMPFKWSFTGGLMNGDDGPLLVLFGSSLLPSLTRKKM